MNWIRVDEKKPDNEQEVLIYWDEREKYGVEQYHVHTYFFKGAFLGYKEDVNIKNGAKRLYDSLNNPNNEMYAEEDGFYFYHSDVILMKHADIITHWMPLERPKDVKP